MTSEEKDMGRKEGRLLLFYTFLYLNIYVFLKAFYFCYFIIKFLGLKKNYFIHKILVGGRERGEFYLIKTCCWCFSLWRCHLGSPAPPPSASRAPVPSVSSCEPPSEVQTARGSDQQHRAHGACSVFLEWQGLPKLTAAKEHSVQYKEFLETQGNFISEYSLLQSLRMYPSIS